MGLDLTKQGNLYQKTNAGRTIGLVGGSAVGYKVLGPRINTFAKEYMIDTFVNDGVKAAAKNAKFCKNLSKHSGAIGAAVTAILCVALGGLFDNTINSVRKKKADKVAKAN